MGISIIKSVVADHQVILEALMAREHGNAQRRLCHALFDEVVGLQFVFSRETDAYLRRLLTPKFAAAELMRTEMQFLSYRIYGEQAGDLPSCGPLATKDAQPYYARCGDETTKMYAYLADRAEADYILTTNPALLTIGRWHNDCRIMSPTDFVLQRLGQERFKELVGNVAELEKPENHFARLTYQRMENPGMAVVYAPPSVAAAPEPKPAAAPTQAFKLVDLADRQQALKFIPTAEVMVGFFADRRNNRPRAALIEAMFEDEQLKPCFSLQTLAHLRSSIEIDDMHRANMLFFGQYVGSAAEQQGKVGAVSKNAALYEMVPPTLQPYLHLADVARAACIVTTLPALLNRESHANTRIISPLDLALARWGAEKTAELSGISVEELPIAKVWKEMAAPPLAAVPAPAGVPDMSVYDPEMFAAIQKDKAPKPIKRTARRTLGG